MRNTLVIMLKEPRPGRVKTRLGSEIGFVPAAWWFRHQSLALIRRLRDPRWNLVLAVSPDGDGLRSRVWPKEAARWPQGQGDLGARMGRMMRRAPGPVCVIGADIPGIQTRHIAQAFAALGASEAVIGPAPDGGYWLIGAKRLRAGALEQVRWSSPYAMGDTIASLGTGRIATIATLRDVDTAADLAAMSQ